MLDTCKAFCIVTSIKRSESFYEICITHMTLSDQSNSNVAPYHDIVWQAGVLWILEIR